jgi:hypothetical protein
VVVKVEGGIWWLCKSRERSGGCVSCGRDLVVV